MKAKFMNFVDQLSRHEMSSIMGGYGGGGVTREEYCTQNRSIREHCCQNMDTQCMDNADAAYDTHCT